LRRTWRAGSGRHRNGPAHSAARLGLGGQLVTTAPSAPAIAQRANGATTCMTSAGDAGRGNAGPVCSCQLWLELTRAPVVQQSPRIACHWISPDCSEQTADQRLCAMPWSEAQRDRLANVMGAQLEAPCVNRADARPTPRLADGWIASHSEIGRWRLAIGRIASHLVYARSAKGSALGAVSTFRLTIMGSDVYWDCRACLVARVPRGPPLLRRVEQGCGELDAAIRVANRSWP
jgi:hypothetical protein